MVYERDININDTNQSDSFEKFKNLKELKKGHISISQVDFILPKIEKAKGGILILTTGTLITPILKQASFISLKSIDSLFIKKSTFIAPQLINTGIIEIKNGVLFAPKLNYFNNKIEITKGSEINGVKFNFNFKHEELRNNLMPVLKRQLVRAKFTNWLKSIS